MSDFYNWEKTLSYDADVTMVIGNRGIGKTFGLRLHCVKKFLKDGYRFVEICRYKNELADVSDGYFDKLARMPELEDYTFRTDAHKGYIAKKTDGKLEWRLICYFVALTDQQKKKKKTFDNVKYLIFDESVLDKHDRYHTYLPNEFITVANLIDTVSRERPGVKGLKPRLFLLGNACDLANPYFAAYKVTSDLDYGYRWYAGKTFLLHYVSDNEYAMEKMEQTVAGRMFAAAGAGQVEVFNEFQTVSMEFVKKRPPHATFGYSILLNGRTFGIWLDSRNGLYFVSNKVDRQSSRTYYLTADDARINYIAARRITPIMQVLKEAYYYGMIRYETIQVKSDFRKVLEFFGVT